MAVRFDADADQYTRSEAISTSANTVSCWIKLTNDRNNFSTIIAFDASTSDYYEFSTQNDGTQLCLFTDGADIISGFNLTAGTWTYVALTFNGTTSTMYWAAAATDALSSSTSAALTVPTSNTIFISEDVFGGDWFDGCMAGMKLWSGVALTQAELEAERWFYTPQRTDSLFAWYPWDQASTVDYSGNGRTLTAGGTPTTEDGPPITWAPQRRNELHALGAAATNAAAATATATGVANGATVTVAPVVGQAAATGVANNATVVTGTAAAAVTATATGVANNAEASVAPSASVATATGVANNATPNYSSNVPGATATATGAANGGQASIGASGGQAAATGTANTSTTTVAPVVGQAAATGVAFDATVVTGTLAAATEATATGVANGATTKVSPVVEQAAATGTAFDATVQTGSFTNAQAVTATATGVANNPSIAIAPNVGGATATGEANGAQLAIGASPTTATAAATAQTAAVAIYVSAVIVLATGTANDATTSGAIVIAATLLPVVVRRRPGVVRLGRNVTVDRTRPGV